jgi:competence protein ComEA
MLRNYLVTIGLACVFAAMAGHALVAQAVQPSAQTGSPAAAKASKKAPRTVVRAPATAANPVNLNTATAVELQTLPKIGAAAAARIIEYRQKSGGFKKVEDLMNVKGIGEKTFLRLKPLVAVSGGTRSGNQ